MNNKLFKTLNILGVLLAIGGLGWLLSNSNTIVSAQDAYSQRTQHLANARNDLANAKKGYQSQEFGFSDNGKIDSSVLADVKQIKTGFNNINTFSNAGMYSQNRKYALAHSFNENDKFEEAYPEKGTDTIEALKLTREPTSVDVYSTDKPRQYRVVVHYNKGESMLSNVPLQDVYEVVLGEGSNPITITQYGQKFGIQMG